MKVTPGPLVGQMSGRLGSAIASHNKGGPYFRNGTIPVTSTTSYALAAKARLGSQSQSWTSLSAANRQAWEEWAAQNPIVDRLGFQRILSGIAAFNQINTRLGAAGQTLLTTPPIIASPGSLLTLVVDGDIGAGDMDLTFTATPLGAGQMLWIRACLVDSPAINNVNSLLRFIGVSAAAETSPFDIETLVTNRFGTPVVGQTLHVFVSVFDSATGLISPPLRDSVVVTSTV